MQNVTTGCILNLEHSNSALHCDCARKQIAILTKDMYKEKHIASYFVTFEEHQRDGSSTDIAQPLRSIMQVI